MNLQAKLPAVETPLLDPPEPYLGADHWLLSSLMQKAIRRGDFHAARRAAHQLLAIDPKRLWRRLMVAGLEDIGIGDLEVSVQLVALAAKSSWREEFGPEATLIDKLIAQACAACKDRTGDHVTSIYGWDRTGEYPKAPNTYGPWALSAVVSDPRQQVRTRFDAAKRCVETFSEKRPRLVRKLFGLATYFDAVREMGCPNALIEACKLYAQCSDDFLPITVPLAWCIWKETEREPHHKLASLETVEFDQGMPSYAFDPLHTRPGKEAVRIWLRTFTRLPWTNPQISATLWNLEAALCDRELLWADGRYLHIMANVSDQLREGVSPESCAALTSWVTENRMSLNDIRQEIWTKLSRPITRRSLT